VNEYSAVQHILPSLAPHLFPDNFNRRGSPRVVLGIPIQYRFGNTIAAALTLNLSHGGIAIRTTSPLEHGSRIKVRSVVALQSVPYGEPIPENWPDIARQLMDHERGRLRGVDGVESDVSYGEPSEELAQFSQDLDLLIVGSRSYGPLGRLINGSTSNYLAEHGRCPLLVLPRSHDQQEQPAQPAT